MVLRLMKQEEKRFSHIGEIEVPKGVEISLEGRDLYVRGPLGSVKKSFNRVPATFQISEDKILFEINRKGVKGRALVNTIKSILSNLFVGVIKGFTYKMKVYYRHFPISVSVKDRYVIIKNFGGERGSRKAKIVGDANISVDGDNIIITGFSKEEVALTAANIQSRCEVKKKDPRIFLDGIYVYSKTEGLESQ